MRVWGAAYRSKNQRGYSLHASVHVCNLGDNDILREGGCREECPRSLRHGSWINDRHRFSAGGAEFNRKLTIYVPFAAGGIVDQTARLVGERLSSQIGQPVVIENRTGANGQFAVSALKAAGPDGHSLLMVSHGMMAINPLCFPTSDTRPRPILCRCRLQSKQRIYCWCRRRARSKCRTTSSRRPSAIQAS